MSHLETLRDNLDLNVEEKTSLLASLRDELAAFRAQTEIEKVNSYLNAHVLSLSLSLSLAFVSSVETFIG